MDSPLILLIVPTQNLVEVLLTHLNLPTVNTYMVGSLERLWGINGAVKKYVLCLTVDTSDE